MLDFNSTTDQGNDMDLNSIEAANFEVMVAEEAILDWLAELDAEDQAARNEAPEPARAAN